ncbi:hypothetical protein BC332_13959 [Capsicum chinense]|nr:hypothetical protein BC332_13959 [Capsicum chinense]
MTFFTQSAAHKHWNNHGTVRLLDIASSFDCWNAGKEDASAGGADDSQEPYQLANSGRMYCKSASWLSLKTSLPPLNLDIEKDGLDPNGGNSSHSRTLLSPRSTQSFKARVRFPPLQPLAIAHCLNWSWA